MKKNKTMNTKYYFLLLIIGFIILTFSMNSCYYDNGEYLYPKLEDDESMSCDTTDITYNDHIKTYLNAKCTSCHCSGGSAAPNLDNFNDAHNYAVTNGAKLYDYVINPNASPQSYVTTVCEKKQLKIWIDSGAN